MKISDIEKEEMLRRRLPVERTKMAYCEYDKEETLHEIDGHGVYGDGPALYCLRCGSARLDMIQGCNAILM